MALNTEGLLINLVVPGVAVVERYRQKSAKLKQQTAAAQTPQALPFDPGMARAQDRRSRDSGSSSEPNEFDEQVYATFTPDERAQIADLNRRSFEAANSGRTFTPTAAERALLDRFQARYQEVVNANAAAIAARGGPRGDGDPFANFRDYHASAEDAAQGIVAGLGNVYNLRGLGQSATDAEGAAEAQTSSNVARLGQVIMIAGAGTSAYHGYKRNRSIGWAIWWGFMGALFPIFTVPIAIAQGFGKRA